MKYAKILAALAMVLVLSSCGGGDTTPSGNSDTNTSTNTPTNNVTDKSSGSKSLQEFKERCEEIDDSGYFYSSEARYAYASSTVTLQEFKERCEEIDDSGYFYSSEARYAYATGR